MISNNIKKVLQANNVFKFANVKKTKMELTLRTPYKTYLEKNCEYPLHAVAKIPVPIEWAFRIENDGLLSPISPEMLQKRSQDLQDAYYDAGAFSWFPAEYFIGKMNSKQKFLSYILEGNRSVDIDTEDDLELAKKLFRVINPK